LVLITYVHHNTRFKEREISKLSLFFSNNYVLQ